MLDGAVDVRRQLSGDGEAPLRGVRFDVAVDRLIDGTVPLGDVLVLEPVQRVDGLVVWLVQSQIGQRHRTGLLFGVGRQIDRVSRVDEADRTVAAVRRPLLADDRLESRGFEDFACPLGLVL